MIDPILLNSVSVFLVQIGARFLKFDLTEAQQRIIKHPWVQSIILISLFYVSTRNIFISSGLVLVYYLCVYFLLNEQSKYNIYDKKWLVREGLAQTTFENKTIEYYSNIKKV